MNERRLAHIVHQAAKFLVSLLEKEYGFGNKNKPIPGVQIHRVDVYALTPTDKV